MIHQVPSHVPAALGSNQQAKREIEYESFKVTLSYFPFHSTLPFGQHIPPLPFPFTSAVCNTRQKTLSGKLQQALREELMGLLDREPRQQQTDHVQPSQYRWVVGTRTFR